MTLTEKAKQAIKSDRVKMLICLDLNIAYGTLRRYLKQESLHPNLTKLKSLEVIKKHTGLKDNEIYNN